MRVIPPTNQLSDMPGRFIPPAAESGGVDAAIVGQGRGRKPVLVGDGEGGLHTQGAGDRGVGGADEQVAGVIIEPFEDLDVGAISQRQWVKSDCQRSFGWDRM